MFCHKLLVRPASQESIIKDWAEAFVQTWEAAVWVCSVKKDVLKNFAKFTGKQVCWSLFLINLQTLYSLGNHQKTYDFKGNRRSKTLVKRLQHRCFPVNIAKFLRTPILKNICERLLPKGVLQKKLLRQISPRKVSPNL